MFAGKTSWDQSRQVFEAIVSSNGWDGVTAVLQLLSHLEGDALNVVLLVPAPRRVLPGLGCLVDVLTEHYCSPGRLRTIGDGLRGLSGSRGQIRRFSRSNWKRWP